MGSFEPIGISPLLQAGANASGRPARKKGAARRAKEIERRFIGDSSKDERMGRTARVFRVAVAVVGVVAGAGRFRVEKDRGSAQGAEQALRTRSTCGERGCS